MDEEIKCGIYVKWITVVLSVTKSCPTLCDPMNCSTPGFPVLHHLPELAQTHVHWVSDAIHPSHPLTPSSSAINLSASGTHPMSRLFWLDEENTGVSTPASILTMNIHGQFPLRLTGLISLLSKGLSGIFFSTIVQRHWWFDITPSLPSSSHNCSWPLERP